MVFKKQLEKDCRANFGVEGGLAGDGAARAARPAPPAPVQTPGDNPPLSVDGTYPKEAVVE
eukprot:9376231-Pyramimonas_sp.AAC.1